MVWNLYGKKYDLNNYLKNNHHPGGNNIIQNTENQKDITALFESYHSFSNRDKKHFIHRLDMYEIRDKDGDTNNFDFVDYNALVNKVKTLFPNRQSIKAPLEWYIQNIFVSGIYILCFYYAMFSSKYSVFYKCIFSQIAGLCYISIGFNVFHDASHYAVSIKPQINELFAKIWASWGLWNSTIWFYHHVLNHHSFTGLEKLDPDLYHLGIFATKTSNDHDKKPPLLLNKTEYIPMITILFPGFYLGQALSYFISIVSYKNKLFRFCFLPTTNHYYDFIDICLICMNLYSLFCGWFYPTFHYIIALNFWYFINIAFDHDTYECIIENHYSGNNWLKIQISHSGNFLNENIVWTRIFGSINYQIEHLLFPNISNYHYPKIASIVREFCKENNIPYVHHSTLYSAYQSYLKMLKYRN